MQKSRKIYINKEILLKLITNYFTIFVVTTYTLLQGLTINPLSKISNERAFKTATLIGPEAEAVIQRGL